MNRIPFFRVFRKRIFDAHPPLIKVVITVNCYLYEEVLFMYDTIFPQIQNTDFNEKDMGL
ncbi:hypothetical protein DWZ14_28810 [Enterocloster citroniae]|nr:hypothetical protein DWZ14_28810 [Enterocloster citroniae]